MRLPLFFFLVPLFQREGGTEKHLSGAVVRRSNTSQACRLRVLLCFMHIHNFPFQNIEHKQTENSAHTTSCFSCLILSPLNPAHFPLEMIV